MADNFFAHETCYIDEPCSIGKGTKIWHFCHVQAGAVIGENCSLGQNVNIADGVRIGNSVKIQNNVSVYKGVVLEDCVFCGPSMVFTNDLNPRCEFPKNGNYVNTLVKRGATIGANATVLCGSTIGEYALIGCGAVVTKNVPPYAIMVGNPARKIGYACRCGEKLEETEIGGYACPQCNKNYKEENQILSEV